MLVARRLMVWPAAAAAAVGPVARLEVCAASSRRPATSDAQSRRTTRDEGRSQRRTATVMSAVMVACALVALCSAPSVGVHASVSSSNSSGSVGPFANAIRQYLPWTQTEATFDVSSSTGWTRITTYYAEGSSLNVDDYPLASVMPQFSIPFGGRAYPTIYLNPNGAIQFDSSLLCCKTVTQDRSAVDKCFQTETCTFNTTYTNMIAPFLADLDLGLTSDSYWSYYSAASVFKVRWLNVPFYNLSSIDLPSGSDFGNTVSFQVDLYADGGIDMHLIEVHSPVEDAANGQSGSWLAGALRYDYSPNYDLLNNYVESPERLVFALQQSSWSTSLVGAYPFKTADSIPASLLALNASAVQSAMRIQYCPVAASWCLTPNAGSTDGGDTVSLVSSDLTCFGSTYQHTAQCRFYPCDTTNSSSASFCTAADTFLATDATYDTLTASLSCTTPTASLFPPDNPVSATAPYSYVEVRLYDATALVEVAFLQSLYFQYLPPAEAAALNASLPTLANPGSYRQDIRLLELGVAPHFCDQCASVATTFCVRDCDGTWDGIAVVDDCGVCTGGTAAQQVYNGDMDCTGRCFLSNTTVAGGAAFSSRAAYCACDNINVTLAEQAETNYGTVLSDDIESTIEEFGCATDQLKDIANTTNDLRFYQYSFIVFVIVSVIGLSIQASIKWCQARSEYADDDDDVADDDDDDQDAATVPDADTDDEPNADVVRSSAMVSLVPESASAPTHRSPHRYVGVGDHDLSLSASSGAHARHARDLPFAPSHSSASASSSSAAMPPTLVAVPVAGVGAALMLGDSDAARRSAHGQLHTRGAADNSAASTSFL